MVRPPLLLLLALVSCGFDTRGLSVRETGPAPSRDGALDLVFPDAPVLPPDVQAVPCTSATCKGCCLNNSCHPGDQIGLCGSGGGSCLDCNGQACVAGTCTAPPAVCQTSSHCGGDLVCVAQSCVAPYARDYTVTVVSASVGAKAFWDTIIPWTPDPFCVVKLAGVEKLKTAIKYDTLSPVWNESVTLRIEKDASLRIECWDDDLMAVETIGVVEWSPLMPAVLKAGTVKQAGSGALTGLVVGFQPK
jgi:hypothetical protein